MSAGATRRARALLWWAVLAAALILAALAVHGQWTARLDAAAYDLAARLRTQATAPSADPVRADPLIVAIDDASLAAIGAWPWPRATQARLVENLARARPRALGLDVLLAEPRPGDDHFSAALDRARAQGLRVVLPVSFRIPGPDGAPFAADRPLPAFAARAAALGHVNLSPDADGVVRRFWRSYGGAGESWTALPAVMLGMAAPRPAPGAALSRTAPLLIGWRGAPGSFPVIPAAAVLSGTVPPSLVAGRDVLVGVTAAGLGDMHAVPVGGGSLMPGVEIQANVLATLRDPAPLRPAPPLLAQALALLPLALLFYAMRAATPARAGLAALGLALGVIAASAALLAFAHVWAPPVSALFALALAWPLWAWTRLVAAGRYIARELERAAAEAGEPAPPTAGPLDRQLALLDAATARERRLRAEHEEAIRLLSHDLRAPQGAILILTEGHADTPLSPEAVERVRDHARRTLALSEGFVHLSRAQLLEWTPELLDLGELARDAADALWPLSRERAMPLEVVVDHGEEILVLGEPSLLARLIGNLAENALKYGRTGSPVTIAIGRANGQAVIAVTNAGEDIPAELQARLFERFARAPGPARREEGFGLGLAFVHAVACRHGGIAACRSAGGQTCFSVTLPLAPPGQG